MEIEDIYTSHGITHINHMDINNIAESFNITLLKGYPLDVRVTSDDIDIIMLKTEESYTMTENFFHEFAHVLIHGHTNINENYRKYCEGQANTLMYQLAIPSFLIKEPGVDYKYLSEKFNVSPQFALKRIEQIQNSFYKTYYC